MAAPATRNWTRPRTDDCHITDDARLTTGPGRYILEAPNGYANAAFVPEPTTRQQKWGAAQVESYIKTDVESDLFNINRGTTREVCGLYDPNDNRMNSANKKAIKEASFPQTFASGYYGGWSVYSFLPSNRSLGHMSATFKVPPLPSSLGPLGLSSLYMYAPP